jgi:hypothetical protein
MSRAAWTLLRRPFFFVMLAYDWAIFRRIRGTSPVIRKELGRISVKRLLRIGLLTAIGMASISSATLFVRSASAGAEPAAAVPRKNKNKNKNKSEHKKEMKKNQKKLILKGRHERHKEKNT